MDYDSVFEFVPESNCQFMLAHLTSDFVHCVQLTSFDSIYEIGSHIQSEAVAIC